LDNLVARIDVPRLEELTITFFNQIIFDTPQVIQFIRRTPGLNAPEVAQVYFEDRVVEVDLSSKTSSFPGQPAGLGVKILCREPDWQISSLVQVFTSCLPPISTLEDLYIVDREAIWKDNIETALWLELLHPFTGVKNLYLSKTIASRIVPALQELVGDRTTEVLSALQRVLLEGHLAWGPVQEGIVQFVVVRQVAGHAIAVAPWETYW
jgi:hypothetical protein